MTTQTPAALQVPVNMTLPEKVIEHITVSNTALEKAANDVQRQSAKQAAVDKLIPSVVEVMVQHERIQPNQREKLAEALKDPVKTLELMIKVAGHRNSDELAKLGQGVTTTPDGQVKTAAANGPGHYDPARSLTDPNVGARSTRVKQSSVNLFKGLGLSPPEE